MTKTPTLQDMIEWLESRCSPSCEPPISDEEIEMLRAIRERLVEDQESLS